MSTPSGYFDRMYAGSSDPWGFRTRWYEQRKRAVTLASLPRARYGRGFEPGCSIGVLTADLATRCDALVAGDPSPAAVSAARSALAASSNVEIRRMQVPRDWPAGDFDLIVLSEVAYYFSPDELSQVVDRCLAGLRPSGTLLACHWRHPVADYPTTGDEVHEAFRSRRELQPLVHHLEEDFVLDVWSVGPTVSIARQDGLLG